MVKIASRGKGFYVDKGIKIGDPSQDPEVAQLMKEWVERNSFDRIQFHHQFELVNEYRDKSSKLGAIANLVSWLRQTHGG